MGQLRYICIPILIQCRSTSHCKDVQSHFLDVNVYKWMLSSTTIEVEVESEYLSFEYIECILKMYSIPMSFTMQILNGQSYIHNEI